MNTAKLRILFERADRSAYYHRTPGCIAEVKVQVVSETPAPVQPVLNKPELVAEFFRTVVTRAAWFDPQKECMIVALLDRKNRLIGWNLVSLGTATAALCHPREIYRPAIVAGASAVVIMHQHPTGDPAPSAPDMQVTRTLREASRTVDIELIDHVVVGDAARDLLGRGHFSFRDAGIL